MYAAYLLREIQEADLHVYLLDNWIRLVEYRVKLLARSFCSDVLTRQLDYVSYSKFAGSYTSISMLLLHSSGLIPSLLNSNLEFRKLVSPRFGIGHV